MPGALSLDSSCTGGSLTGTACFKHRGMHFAGAVPAARGGGGGGGGGVNLRTALSHGEILSILPVPATYSSLAATAKSRVAVAD